MNKSYKPVVRAIDVGFGTTKFTNSISSNNEPTFMTIPSIVCAAVDSLESAGTLMDRNTNKINHNGMLFEAGADVLACASNTIDGRLLNDQYIHSVEYEVLMKIALKAMNLKLIDYLVVGTPVNKIETEKKYLETKWTGEIQLSDSNTVLIKNIIVVAQPVGGFVSLRKSISSYASIKNQKNLIIDCGYFTLDWVVIDKLIPTINQGSLEAGMSAYIRAIIDQMGTDADNIFMIERVDNYIRTKQSFNFNGQAQQLEKFFPAANVFIEKAVEKMLSEINITTVDNVVLMGGSAHIYENSIRKRFKNWNIIKPESGNLGNVMGYQIIGDARSNSHIGKV